MGDIERVKAQIVGDYIMNCRNANKPLTECTQSTKTVLGSELKSSLSVDNALIRSQFNIFKLDVSCRGSICEEDIKNQIRKLGLAESEIKARKYSSALSHAA